MGPLVSVICLCFNHERFLLEALFSIINQTYSNLEIIIVDDASTDNSVELLKEFKLKYPKCQLILNQVNIGNCKSFNKAFEKSKGKYIIDFSTDDVLLPNRIAEQVYAFERLDESYGVIYTDAELIDNSSLHKGFFYKRNRINKIKSPPPSGYVFTHILRKTFLCPPTLMFKRELLSKLGGYDSTLAYEDFDIWVRSAQEYQFYFLNKILTKRRIHVDSLSCKQYKPGDKQLASTVKICRKAKSLIRNKEEKEALIFRVKSEIKQAFFTENFKECTNLFLLLKELTHLPMVYKCLYLLNKNRVRLGVIRRFYYKIYYGK
ncbi:glycosyltransferase [Adhaeribacter aquaticus]|uniref:glycosyltransferase n=1 Tax=Adhaeribacter aquaticus TaxID=299567 RepID=UPI0004299C13|nr:glycosyltransferase [Adhaeribacter aquaticus]